MDTGALSELFGPYGVVAPEILLPDAAKCDLAKWSVVACDQFTSQPEYWDKVGEYVGDSPSSLRLTLPEAFLGEGFADRAAGIHKKMGEYLAAGIFAEPKEGFILTEREYTDKNGAVQNRWGLILAIDLEKYSYIPGDKTLVRSSEETVRDRLPPRICVRRGAALELPHVLVLADDPERLLIEPLAVNARAGLYKKEYDFELMERGGRLRGYFIGGDALMKVADALAGLLRNARAASEEPLLFAVGDGNHSLAAAKAYWDEIKAAAGAAEHAVSLSRHPAGCALVEIINLYSDAVVFEPIHRALYNADHGAVIKYASDYFADRGFSFRGFKSDVVPEDVAAAADGATLADGAAAADVAADSGSCGYKYLLTYGNGKKAELCVSNPQTGLPVAEIQGFIDDFCRKNPGVKVDYIHGSDELARLNAEEGCFCLALPPVDKNGFFAAIAAGGVMPRKAFSMGEAREKRYYLEARKIVP